MNQFIKTRIFFFLFLSNFIWVVQSDAQVNMVEFGKNRVQHNKFKWQFYQSPNFNVHYNQKGLELAKFTTQTAEAELPEIEQFVEFSIQRRINIVLYNHYNDYKQSNIGIGLNWPNMGGVTKLVNNKMVVYFNGDHNDLRRQIRQGIARVLVETLLFGDDIGEFAQNQALLNLPKWMTDGYISYVAENWNTQLDNQLKSAILAYKYKNFYQFAFAQPDLAGHAFWYYIEEKYKRESVNYILYLSRIYKNINKATIAVCQKKLKQVLIDFMQFNQKKYLQDLQSRKDRPSGKLSVLKEIRKKDYLKFQPNPNPKNNAYTFVQFRKGVSKVVYTENFYKQNILWRSGVQNLEERQNPNYPLLAWDPKGTQIAMVVWKKGSVILHLYNTLTKKREINGKKLALEQVNDIQFMLDANTIILSGVRGGQSDIFIYKIAENKLDQITNDIYDDLDASFVTFPNKTGILFSSNRPSPYAPGGDSVQPKNRYNIFLIDNWNRSEFKQITQLSKLKFGDARYPSQYNVNHFTFVSDENGIGNRWAGFFNTSAAGLDTVYQVGEELLRNPASKDLDSVLNAWNKTEPDSVYTFRVTEDTAYTFPLTNYQNSILETRIAGDKGQISEVNRQGAFKFIYKLKVDEVVLKKRNINARPTEYVKRLSRLQMVSNANLTESTDLTDSIPKQLPVENLFESEFENDTDTLLNPNPILYTAPEKLNVLKRMRVFPYEKKYFIDNLTTSFLSNNAILINRFQPYSGASGPVQLGNNNALNAMTRVGAMEFLEDYKFSGGFRINYGLDDKEVFMRFDNLARRIDWGLTYYRSTKNASVTDGVTFFDTKQISNIYQGNIIYPFNEVQSLRLIAGIRSDKYVIRTDDLNPISLIAPNLEEHYLMLRGEYVHDNTIAPASNIWHGLRYKAWFEMYQRMGGNYTAGANGRSSKGKMTFNFGFDVRHYYPIYRNLIWAVRGAGDFSWGNNKFIYYLGGTDGWLMLGSNTVVRDGVQKERYFNTSNRPAPDQTYVYESLAVNLRGFTQNAANGNNAVVINSEIRFPVFTTLLNRPVNNSFLSNFQLVQFIDLGTAWNGKYSSFSRPQSVFTEENNPLTVIVKGPGLGPFLGSYGFGARTTLLGYFIRFDVGWQMNSFFKNKPIMHFSLGFDF
jgi:hypothetical protein